MPIPKTFINTNQNNLTLAEIREKNYRNGYEMAIDDFAERLCYKIKSEIDDCADELQWIDKIAEQLKEGVDNA